MHSYDTYLTVYNLAVIGKFEPVREDWASYRTFRELFRQRVTFTYQRIRNLVAPKKPLGILFKKL